MDVAQMSEVEKKLIQARESAQNLRVANEKSKNAVLQSAAELLLKRLPDLLRANSEDLANLSQEATAAFRDRLMLNESRVKLMNESLKQVAALPDPVNEEVERRRLQNGLLVRKIRSPLGVILMIFESRPNVAIEAFSLAFKSGNVAILRGGKESMRTTSVLYQVLAEALIANGFSSSVVWGVTNPERNLAAHLLKQDKYIDVVVPRGGDALIEFVVANARMPIIKNDRGLCHVYIHCDADLEISAKIVENAKCQRPGVCNSMETLLVHNDVAETILPRIFAQLKKNNVEWFGDARTCQILDREQGVSLADESAWSTEYLSYKINCKVVDSLNDAMAHIEKYGSRHSESIVTSSEDAARLFQTRVDAAVVYWNASTRFTDGFELGLGGELGISTQKLHVRGPVGLRELTSVRWIIDGSGQVRG